MMNLGIKKIDHVQICIPVGMESEARVFYIEKLGFREVEKPEALKRNGGFWLEAGDVQLHIGAEEGITKSKRHPAFEVDNLDDARTLLEGHQVSIKEDTAIPGVKRFSFFDPWMNRIELLTHE